MKFRRCIFTFSINHDIRHFPILLCLCKNGKGDVSKKVMHFLSCYFACQWLEVFGFCFFYVLVAVASLDRYVPIDMDDVSCQNWPITGYTRSWYTAMMYWKKCLQAPLPVSPKLPRGFPAAFLDALSPLSWSLEQSIRLRLKENMPCIQSVFCPKILQMFNGV